MRGPIWVRLRAAGRGLRIIGHLLLGAFIVVGWTLARSLGRRNGASPAVVCWWYRRLIPMLGLRVRVVGAPAERALLIANHISWLDIPVLGSIGDISFLSKDEIRRWPLIGWMSEQVGTLFIKRGGHQTAELIEQIQARVSQGQPVVIFPEGTTSDGRRLRRFHPRLMAPALQPGIDAQPLTIRYGDHAEPDRIAPFIGDDALLPHLWRVLCQPQIGVQVEFLSRVSSVGMDRRALARVCQDQIALALGVPVDASARSGHRAGAPAS